MRTRRAEGTSAEGSSSVRQKKKRPCSREGGRRSQNRPQEATGFPGSGPNGEVVVIRSEPGLLAWGGFFLHCGSSRTLDRSRFPKAGSRPAGLDGSGPPRARFARAGPGGYPPTRVCPRLKWPRCFFFPSTNCGVSCAHDGSARALSGRFLQGEAPTGRPLGPSPCLTFDLRSCLPTTKLHFRSLRCANRSIVPGRLSERGKALLVSRWLRMQSQETRKTLPARLEF